MKVILTIFNLIEPNIQSFASNDIPLSTYYILLQKNAFTFYPSKLSEVHFHISCYFVYRSTYLSVRPHENCCGPFLIFWLYLYCSDTKTIHAMFPYYCFLGLSVITSKEKKIWWFFFGNLFFLIASNKTSRFSIVCFHYQVFFYNFPYL